MNDTAGSYIFICLILSSKNAVGLWFLTFCNYFYSDSVRNLFVGGLTLCATIPHA